MPEKTEEKNDGEGGGEGNGLIPRWHQCAL